MVKISKSKKNKRGFLLALLTLIIFILMLGELITYVVVSSNYYALSGDTALALNSGTSVNINAGISQFLASSLHQALISMSNYELNGSLYNGSFVNNTAYTINTLVYNGMLNGKSLQSMNGYTLNNYLNALKSSYASSQVYINITGSKLYIYQTNPLYVNISYSGFVSITQPGSITSYPIDANASVALSGIDNLFAAQHGIKYQMYPNNNPSAISLIAQNVINNASRSPFMFAYGRIYYYPGSAAPINGCASLSHQYENQQYILVAYNTMTINSSACNFAGIVTNIRNASPIYKPYIIANSTMSNLAQMNIPNGTYTLLNGPQADLMDISPLENNLNGSYIYPYQSAAQYIAPFGVLGQGSNNGAFDFFNYKLKSAQISSPQGLPSTSIGQNGIYAMNTILSHLGFNYTLSVWFNLKSESSSASTSSGKHSFASPLFDIYNKTGFDFGTLWAGGNVFTPGSYSQNIAWTQNYTSSNALLQNSCDTFNGTVHANNWYNAIVKVQNYTNVSIYINGVMVNDCNMQTNTILVSQNSIALAYSIGADPGSTNAIANASIANIQLYNSTLNNFQIGQIYRNGIEGLPIVANHPECYSYNICLILTINNELTAGANSLILWDLLNGNTNYYNGTLVAKNILPKSISNNIQFTDITNYSVDTTDNYIPGIMNASAVYGEGCYNAQNCSAPLLYTASATNVGSGSAILNASNNDYMYAPMGKWMTQDRNMSIATWFNSTNYGGTIFGVSASPTGGSELSYISMNNSGWINGYLPGVVTLISPLKYKGAFNTTYFVALTYNSVSGLAVMYVNGKRVYSVIGTSAPNVEDTYFTDNVVGSGSPPGTPQYFTGSVSGVQLYSQNLSANQVRYLYVNGPKAAALQGNQDWWTMSNNMYDFGAAQNNGFFKGTFINNTLSDSSPLGVFNIQKGAMPAYVYVNPDAGANMLGYVNIPALVPKSYSQFSYFGWIYASSNEINAHVITTSAGDSGTIELGVGNYTHPRLMYSGGGLSGWTQVGNAFKENSWNFVGVVYNTSGAHIFLNGQDVHDLSLSESGVVSGNMQIGDSSSISGITNQFFGGVSDFLFYNTGLNKSQVMDVYSNNTDPYATAYAQLPLQGAFNSTLNQTPDISGNGFIGYLVGNTIGGVCSTSQVALDECGVYYR